MNIRPTYYRVGVTQESDRALLTSAFLWLSIALTTSLFISQSMPAGLLEESLSMLLVGIPAFIGLLEALEILNRLVDQIGAADE